jgi:transcriptional regulator with XRE-family HTH domain
MNLNQDIAGTVLNYLKQHNITQRELAEGMGLHETALSSLLSGKRNWTIRTLTLLAKNTGLYFQVGDKNDD